MRMMPSRYASKAQPVKVKQGNTAAVAHVTAPLKGLSLSSALTTGDPLKASILENWVLDEDKIRCRPGRSRVFTHPDAKPVEALVPFYGTPTPNMALATNGKLTTFSGITLHSGYLSNDWAWMSFANLGTKTYTLMVNGADGVWSWDGTNLAAGLVKETVTAPATATWINPNKFSIIMLHQNHVWFADDVNLAVYYLPLQTKSGEVKQLPLSALFKRGGSIRAIYSWTVDGGAGINDQLVIFSSNGECAIYQGTDPDTNFQLRGVFRFDSPMSKNCVAQYGGELYVLISTGLVPMSVMMKAETEQLGQTDKDVYSAFMDASRRFRSQPGWQLLLDPSTSRMICNMPQGGSNHYGQMVRSMPNSYWTTWSAIPSRSWCWLDNTLYLGDDLGRLYATDRSFLSDDGAAIRVDVQFAWSNFKSPAIKHFKMLKPYIITDGQPKPMIDMQVDYQTTPPQNQPDLTFSTSGAEWDTASWDTSDWAPPSTMIGKWSGVGRMGNVGAVRIQALISGCEFAISGADVLYETGSVMG
jgi:hypothetical protein